MRTILTIVLLLGSKLCLAQCSPLEVVYGGTAKCSWTNGIVRVDSNIFSSAELTGDCTTSGSNVTTCNGGSNPYPRLIYSTPLDPFTAQTTGIAISTVTVVTPSSDHSYTIGGDFSQETVGTGGTCSNQGTVGLRVDYTDAISGVHITGSNNGGVILGGGSSPTAGIAFGSSITLNDTARVVVLSIRVKASTALVLILFQQAATNCTTPATGGWYPEVWDNGH